MSWMQFQITTIQRGKHAPQKTTNGDQHQHNMDTIISKEELFKLPLPTFIVLTSYITVIQLCAVLCWVAQSCPTLHDPMDCSPPGSSDNGDSPGKNTGVGCHALPPGERPNPGIKPGSPALQVDFLPAEILGKPRFMLFLLKQIPKCIYIYQGTSIVNQTLQMKACLCYLI